MAKENPPQLRVFLCHSEEDADRQAVHNLSYRLQASGIAPWFAEVDLLPEQNPDQETEKAIRDADVVLVCLSSHAVSTASPFHAHIKLALDKADKQSDETIYVIPLKLDPCDVPEHLRHLHAETLTPPKAISNS